METRYARKVSCIMAAPSLPEVNMAYSTVTYEPGRIARLILDRPDTLNAQSRLMLKEIDLALDEAARDGDVRVVVVSGAGPHFSAGHDVREMADPELPPETAGQRYQRMKQAYIEDHLRWRNLAKPTIAMVHGYCIWGGWMVASAMDLVFASDDAQFLAYPSPADFWALPWDMPPKKAKEILFEHRVLSAGEALSVGFVNRVYSRDQLEAQTMAYAERVADNDPAMVLSAKYAINDSLDQMGYSASVTNAFHIGSAFGFARTANEPHKAYASFASAQENPHANRVRTAFERFRQDQKADKQQD